MVSRSPTANTTSRSCTTRPVFRHPKESIGYFHVVMSNGHTCHNREPVTNLQECSGSCGASPDFIKLMQGVQNSCLSCQMVRATVHSIQLTCTDGSFVNKAYKVPQLCACDACSDQL